MDYYTCQKITERITLICATYGNHHNVMQVLVGDREAAIIDTGMGATGNIRKLVGEITPLPVTCFLTHMHPDHAGGSMLFDKRYMHPADEVHCWWALTKEKRGLDLEDACAADPELRRHVEAEMADNSDFTYLPMKDGDVFDLGGVTLEVLAVEGHTEGSVVLYCKEENALFGGDTAAPRLILVGENKTRLTPLRTTYDQLTRVAGRLNGETKVFCGHAAKALPAAVVEDALKAMEAVMEDRASKTISKHPKFGKSEDGTPVYEETAGLATIMYSAASLK